MPWEAQRLLEERRHGEPIGDAADERSVGTSKKAARQETLRIRDDQRERQEKYDSGKEQRLVRLVPQTPKHQPTAFSTKYAMRKSAMPAIAPTTEPLMRIICRSSSTRLSTKAMSSSSEKSSSRALTICVIKA